MGSTLTKRVYRDARLPSERPWLAEGVEVAACFRPIGSTRTLPCTFFFCVLAGMLQSGSGAHVGARGSPFEPQFG
eukprot:7273373-Pyramimonas_sp.AAC.1